MAGLDLKIDWQGMKNEFKKYAQDEAKRLAIKARKEICEEYQSAISTFYAEFTPTEWERMYEYYHSFTPFYENSHGMIYYGGIDINPSRMYDHYQEGSQAAINTMLLGVHGPIWGRGPKTGFPVQAHMQRFVENLAAYISL